MSWFLLLWWLVWRFVAGLQAGFKVWVAELDAQLFV
jgi:hypothetical protein